MPNNTAPAATARFPKSSRLLKHADFDLVYRSGRRHFSPSFTVFWLRRGSAPGRSENQGAVTPIASGPRVGFTVGRVMGGSVVRNRIRRRLREAVRLNLARLSAAVDIVINPKKSALRVDFAQLSSEVAEAFRAVEQGRGGSEPRILTRKR